MAIARKMKLNQTDGARAFTGQELEQIGYALAIGIVCVVISQVLFSQWSLMNQLFVTVPLNLVQAVICIGVGFPAIIVGLLLNRFDPIN